MFGSFVKGIFNRYNETSKYLQYDTNENKFDVVEFTQSVRDVVVCDIATIGIIYYILSNL
jgi:hypothetical protein